MQCRRSRGMSTTRTSAARCGRSSVFLNDSCSGLSCSARVKPHRRHSHRIPSAAQTFEASLRETVAVARAKGHRSSPTISFPRPGAG
jgi:hypothetical protein